MKPHIVVVLVLLFAFVIGAIFTAVGTEKAKRLYDKGHTVGEKLGFERGYVTCYNVLGLNWLGSRERFAGFAREYGSLHNTPWEKFTVEEKVVIAMYGGSGSKLEPEEIAEWARKYGRAD